MSFRNFENNICRLDAKVLNDPHGFSLGKGRIINRVRMDINKYLLARTNFTKVIESRFTADFFKREKESLRLGKRKNSIRFLKIAVFRASDQGLPAQDGSRANGYYRLINGMQFPLGKNFLEFGKMLDRLDANQSFRYAKGPLGCVIKLDVDILFVIRNGRIADMDIHLSIGEMQELFIHVVPDPFPVSY